MTNTMMLMTLQEAMHAGQAGEFPFETQGHAGVIEGVITLPGGALPTAWLSIGHPHPLQGGSMNNKVVTTIARAAKDCSIASIRFNFRGVGKSEGVYDAGEGESQDMLKLVDGVLEQLPNAQLLFAGFSFGSYVAYKAAIMRPHTLLLSIAPPVSRYPYDAFSPAPAPWYLIKAGADEVVDVAEIDAFLQAHPKIHAIDFVGASHFFHGRLLELREVLSQILREAVPV